jgi:serine protease Do
MADLSGNAQAVLAGARMIEDAQRSVVQVRSGERGIGAGVIWRPDGLVLTNHHVVAGGRRDVTVALQDGRTFGADVVKSTRSLDLALLKLEGDHGDLPAAPVGDSDALRVGELVYAIGHPWGRVGAVSAGIIGGVGELRGPRPRRGSSTRYVRSDVTLAPGNSGGPLLNARGKVVAINAMIFGSMAVSIPSNAASAWVAAERRQRLGIGVLPVELPLSTRKEAGASGLVVAAVETAGAADRAGLLVGDVLLDVAGEPLGEPGTLLEALARAGDAVSLRVMRGGRIMVMEVRLEEAGRAA